MVFALSGTALILQIVISILKVVLSGILHGVSEGSLGIFSCFYLVLEYSFPSHNPHAFLDLDRGHEHNALSKDSSTQIALTVRNACIKIGSSVPCRILTWLGGKAK